MKAAWILVASLGVGGTAMADGGCAWSTALWDEPLNGSRIVADPNLRDCAVALAQRPGRHRGIRHAADDDSALVASELRLWLLALALEPGRVELREDANLRGPVQLIIEEGER